MHTGVCIFQLIVALYQSRTPLGPESESGCGQPSPYRNACGTDS